MKHLFPDYWVDSIKGGSSAGSTTVDRPYKAKGNARKFAKSVLFYPSAPMHWD
jgi:hypothetical protein